MAAFTIPYKRMTAISKTDSIWGGGEERIGLVICIGRQLELRYGLLGIKVGICLIFSCRLSLTYSHFIV